MNDNYVLDKELSFKEIFLKIKSTYLLLRPHFILIATLSIIGGAIGYGYAYLIPPKYEATLTFMVDAGKTNSLGGMSQLASTFGLGSFGSSNTLDTKKMEDLLLSNKINCITLFEKETINGKTDYLANHFINLFNIRNEKGFVKNDSIKDFIAFTHADYKRFSQKESTVLNLILDRIIGRQGLLTVEVAKNEIITVRLTSESELFSKYYVEHLVNALTNFYVSSTVKKERISLDIITNREDSVKKALYAAEYAYATYKDENLRMIKVQGFVEELRLKRNIEILNAMYGEIIKSKEMANFALLNKTPLFQIIDEPSFPLDVLQKSKSLFLMIGFCLGFFFISCSLILKHYYYVFSEKSSTHESE